MHDIAILHDQLRERGGAEHVAFELARTFDAPIFAAAVDDSIIPDDVEAREVFDDGVPARCMDSHHVVQDIGQMFGWQHVEALYEYDTLIVNKNNPGWYVPRDHQTVVKYCHTTPRGPYDLFHRHAAPVELSDKKLKPFSRVLEPLLTGVNWGMKTAMRTLYTPNISYPDQWIVNSDLVQRRLNLYFDVPPRESEVVYPPVAVDDYSPSLAPTEDYYFTFSRLVPDKRIDDIVETFADIDARLVVGGDGPERDHLEAIAPGNVEFVGYMSEREKKRRLSEAKAFVFNAENEDFGLVPVEAMAAGTPVIGVEDGFTQHQIIDGKNGYTYPRAGGHLRERLRYFETNPVEWTGEEIAAFADRFSAQRFRRKMRELVAETESRTQIRPDWQTDDVGEVDPVAGEVALPDGGDA